MVFDLARDVDVHMASTSRSAERVVDGVRHGLMNSGDEVTWEARHLGATRRMRVRVTWLEMPRAFTDEMVWGRFTRMRHVHRFEERAGTTVMRDEFDYELGFGVVGALIEAIVVTPYLRGFLRARAGHLKRAAESQSR